MTDEQRDALLRNTPLARIGTAQVRYARMPPSLSVMHPLTRKLPLVQEVAHVIAMVAVSTYMTGAVVNVEGGLGM